MGEYITLRLTGGFDTNYKFEREISIPAVGEEEAVLYEAIFSIEYVNNNHFTCSWPTPEGRHVHFDDMGSAELIKLNRDWDPLVASVFLLLKRK